MACEYSAGTSLPVQPDAKQILGGRAIGANIVVVPEYQGKKKDRPPGTL
jgi:hypothetical protein